MRKNYSVIKPLLAYLLFFYVVFYQAQTTSGFAWPIDTPHTLTGNYGELRPNHFHMGIDFSTNGQINFPVYAVADGYVSRIKVSPAGYGKAIYITHSTGKVSVYAHFTSYAGDIATAVKQQQYEKKSYAVEFFPKPNELKIKKGELIGYSGNSGSSSGPHLHFEIRDAKTEIPFNTLEFYKISDTTRPVITHAALYNLADTAHPVFIRSLAIDHNKRDSLYLHNDSVILDQAILGFAFAGYDQFVHKGNANVIHAAKLYVDDQLIYAHALDHISFDDQRFVNEFSETLNKVKYQKCFLPTLYPKGIYQDGINKGRIVLTDTNYHHLRLSVYDESGNERVLSFYIRSKKLNGYAVPSVKGDVAVICNRDFPAAKNGLRIYIPAGTLYRSAPLFIINSLEQKNSFTVLPSDLNLAAMASLGFKIPQRLLKYKEKLVVKNNSAIYVPSCQGDSAFCQTYNFGRFELTTDTLAPKIKTQLSPKKIKRLKNPTSFSFVVRDYLAGIGNYSLYLNGQWVLAEYDAKNCLLTYFFDELTPPGSLSFTVQAEDRVGNKAVLNYVLKR